MGCVSARFEKSGKVAEMEMKSVWGFDPDEAMRAQRLFRGEPAEEESAYNDREQHAARIPADAASQIYELCRMFRS